jgi:hypothetical protein
MTADEWRGLAEAFAFIFIVWGLVPLAILAAYYAGERAEARRQARRGFDRHAEDAVRMVREWPR